MVIYQRQIMPVLFNPGRDHLQGLLGMGMVIGDQSAGDHCVMPDVMIAYLSDRNIEFPVKAVDKRFYAAAFLFQRSTARQLQMKR